LFFLSPINSLQLSSRTTGIYQCSYQDANDGKEEGEEGEERKDSRLSTLNDYALPPRHFSPPSTSTTSSRSSRLDLLTLRHLRFGSSFSHPSPSSSQTTSRLCPASSIPRTRYLGHDLLHLLARNRPRLYPRRPEMSSWDWRRLVVRPTVSSPLQNEC
jgi:hypothetical protein